MQGFDFYKLYLAVRLHFTNDKYDIVESRGRTKTSEYSYEAKKDKFRFDRIASRFTQPEAINFLVANIVNGDHYCGIYSQESNDVYLSWKGRKSQMEYLFDNDVTTLYYEALRAGVRDIFSCEDGHPFILKRYLSNKISIENLVIMNKLSPFVNKIDEQISDDIVWGDIRRRIIKYSVFVKIKEHREHFVEKLNYVVSEFEMALKDMPIIEKPVQKADYNILDIMGME